MTGEGRMLFGRKVIDLGDDYDPVGSMEFKVITHNEDGEQLWSSYRDYHLFLVKKNS